MTREVAVAFASQAQKIDVWAKLLDMSVVDTISLILGKITTQNVDVVFHPSNETITPFETTWTYEWVNIRDYMNRLKEWISCGPESYVYALCLLKKLEAAGAVPTLTQKSIHRVFFTAFVIAVKMMEDETLRNCDFAKVGCMTTAELFEMELYAFKALNFSCCVSQAEFSDCCRELRYAEACFQTQNMKPFSRQGAEPASICLITKELQPPAPARRMSLFHLHRKSVSKPSVPATPPSKHQEPSSTTTVIATSPKSSAPSGIRRATSVGFSLNRKFFTSTRDSIDNTNPKKATPRVLLRQDSL